MKRTISLTIYHDSTGHEFICGTIKKPESIGFTPISEPQEVELDFVGLGDKEQKAAREKAERIKALEQELKTLKGY